MLLEADGVAPGHDFVLPAPGQDILAGGDGLVAETVGFPFVAEPVDTLIEVIQMAFAGPPEIRYRDLRTACSQFRGGLPLIANRQKSHT